ncbi:MAG: hypothetical protein LBU79_08690 [Planctomycetota bacterium]|jgi:hypothetical protein|nr:hypothetical protein [Planctomycetota bacterium]
MSESISSFEKSVLRAKAVVEQRFLYRKLGIPYDYSTPEEGFPSRSLATTKEAKASIPNPSGLGAGFYHSCRNHSLLFDSYLLRLELGIEVANDELILDRLIGGLIRLATVAPKAFLVGGISPDGRGFYHHSSWQNQAAWCFAVARGLTTSAIAPESQEKFAAIVGKWLERLRRDRFVVTSFDGRPQGGDLADLDSGCGPVYLAIHLTAWLASRQTEDYTAFAAAAMEEEGRRLVTPLPKAEPEPVADLLWRQAALALLLKHDNNPERQERVRRCLSINAQAAAEWVGGSRAWREPLDGIYPTLDWRRFPRASLEESRGFGFSPFSHWEWLENEQNLAAAWAAAYVVFLAADVELAERVAAELGEALERVPWEKITGLTALAPILGIHARGVELGLWDKDLTLKRHSFQFAAESFAAKYMEPDYDRENPGKAGHSQPPPGKEEPLPLPRNGEGFRRRKRRRRH